jgi:hypothetical protein
LRALRKSPSSLKKKLLVMMGASFFDSQPGSRSWSYDSLKNFRQISPAVQNHLKRVSFFAADVYSYHTPNRDV